MGRRKAGWYTDPNDPNLSRQWDGKDWSPNTRKNPFSPYAQNRLAKKLATVAVSLFAALVIITMLFAITYTTSTGTGLGSSFLIAYKHITLLSFGAVFIPSALAFFAMAFNKLKQVNPVVETVCYFMLFFAVFTLLNTGEWSDYVTVFNELTR